MSAAVTFATVRIESEYGQLPKRNPLLRRILDEAADHAFDELQGWIICLSDIFRTPQEAAEIDRKSLAPGGLGMGRAPGSVSPHCVWRAGDIRTRTVGQARANALADWINSRWIYNPSDPVRKVADARPHGTAPHVHVQTHPATRLRNPE